MNIVDTEILMALCKLPVGESGFRLQGFRLKDLPAPCGDLADDVPVVNGRKAPGGSRPLFLKHFPCVNVQQLQGLLPPVAQDRAVVHKQACNATLAFASPNQFAAAGIQAEQAPFLRILHRFYINHGFDFTRAR